MVMLPSLRLMGKTPRGRKGENVLIGVVDALYRMVPWSYGVVWPWWGCLFNVVYNRV